MQINSIKNNLNKRALLLLLFVHGEFSLFCVTQLIITTSDGKHFVYHDCDILALRSNETVNNFLRDFEDQKEAAMYLSDVDAFDWKIIARCSQLLYKAYQLEGTAQEELLKQIDNILNIPTHSRAYSFINSVNYLNNVQLLDKALVQWMLSRALDFFEARNDNYKFNEHITKLLQQKLIHYLNTTFAKDRQKPILCKKLQGHSGVVRLVRFNPDGSSIASCSDDTTIGIWCARTGRLINNLMVHNASVRAICYNKKGNLLASSARDSKICIWDTYKGKLLHLLAGDEGYKHSICFSPDSKFIAFGSENAAILIWDVCTGSLTRTFKGHSSPINEISYSPNGNLLASCSSDYNLCLWNTKTHDLMFTLKGHSGSVWSICYSPDGNSIASGGFDGTLRIWDSRTASLIHTFLERYGLILVIRYSPDGNFIASGATNKVVRIWDTHKKTLAHTLKAHTGSVASLCYSSDGNFIFSGSNHKIYIWDTESGNLMHRIPGFSHLVTSLSCSADGNLIASGSTNGTICIWDFSKSLNQMIQHSTMNQHMLLALAFRKKNNKKSLMLDKTHLKSLFEMFNEDERRLIQRILPVTIPRSINY